VTDKGWMPRTRQVGITGRSISPRLFISIGASGKFNHVVGARGAHLVVAINNDPGALIFDSSDIGIVGDWQEVISLLTEAIAAEVTTASVEQPLRRYDTLGTHHGGVIVLVQREPDEPGVLQCDGARLVSRRPLPCSTPVPNEEGFDIRASERLADDQSGLELICTKGGTGTLTFNGRPLRHLREADSRTTSSA
jgi:hypothetical protein